MEYNRKDFIPQVGDRVRIRSLDDMINEFGKEDGAVQCKFKFVKDMESLCGLEFVIDSISGGSYLGHNTDWNISKDMLEPADFCVDEEFQDSEEMEEFLGGIRII